MKALLKKSITLNALVKATERIAMRMSLQFATFAFALVVATFCGIDGGYQFHLIHDHPAVRCAAVAIAMNELNGNDPLPLRSAPLSCNAPDEVGQPWRMELVLRDMLGFLVFGMFVFFRSERSIRAAAEN